MLDPTLFILSAGGLALGAGVAQLRGPTYWNWEGHVGDLRRRLSCLPRNAPPAARRAAGLAVLAALLSGGALTAYAAQPSIPERAAGSRYSTARQMILGPEKAPEPLRLAAAAAPSLPPRLPPPTGPDALPAQVRGVVGSGAQLALQLKPLGDGPARTLIIGDVFENGWVLSGLDASTATLTKAGASRTVGLNPSGVVASAAASVGGSSVTVVSTLQAQADAEMASAQADLERARAALQTAGATPEAVNAARMAVINAQNATLKAQNDAIRAQNGLPPLPPPPTPPHYSSVAEAQAALDKATADFNDAPPDSRAALQQALQTATIALTNTRREASAAQQTGQSPQ